MNDASTAGIILSGIYLGFILWGLIIGWSEWSKPQRFWIGAVIIFLFSVFMYFVVSKIRTLNRPPVISCRTLRESGGFLLVDSTLRCGREGEMDCCYTVIKTDSLIVMNDSSLCVHCNKKMLDHYDKSTCEKTEDQIDAENMLDYTISPI